MNKNIQSDTNENLAQWQLFLQGDDEAYAWIYARHIHQLFQYGCRFCDDQEIVKDCIQNLFVDIYQKRKKLPMPDNVKVYLMTALRYNLFNVFNRMTLHNAYITNLSFDFDLSVEDEFIEAENQISERQTIDHLLSTLSPRQREIIYYRFYEGLKYEDICQLMDLNYQSAYNLLQRSLAKLRESYGISFLFLAHLNVLSLKNFIFCE